jgi:hypothetical protein
MPAHMEGYEGNLSTGTQIQSLRILGPLGGARMCQLLAIPCVASSLALVARGDSDLTSRLCLGTLSYRRPMTIVGPILDTFTVSDDVVVMSCEELERCVNMGLVCHFTTPVRARCFASSVVTLRGYKVGGCPCTNLRPLARTPIASSPPSLCLKS